jgi:hypothetical protein
MYHLLLYSCKAVVAEEQFIGGKRKKHEKEWTRLLFSVAINSPKGYTIFLKQYIVYISLSDPSLVLACIHVSQSESERRSNVLRKKSFEPHPTFSS